MDAGFSRFLERFDNPVGRQDVPISSINFYKNKLPDLLLEIWAEHGWCGYGNGIFWIVNPEEYAGVAAAWLGGTHYAEYDTYHIFARSAFGDLYLWGENTGPSLKIASIVNRASGVKLDYVKDQADEELSIFFRTRQIETSDDDDYFEPTRKKLGILKPDEMYGFVPALMLGGPDKLENLQIVKAVEHLIFLSQVDELVPFDFSDF